ncbi:MAG: hypothetical protein M5U28_54220 [Sandaracinaceae bacterium]|nr:hypothetical protein [Sandaracinaceae bacterium]
MLRPEGERSEHGGEALTEPIEITDALAPGVYRVQVATASARWRRSRGSPSWRRRRPRRVT